MKLEGLRKAIDILKSYNICPRKIVLEPSDFDEIAKEIEPIARFPLKPEKPQEPDYKHVKVIRGRALIRPRVDKKIEPFS